MKLRNVLLAATILAAPVAAKAQPVTGLYVGAGVGYDYLTQTDIRNVTIGPLTTGQINNSRSTSGLKTDSRGGFTGDLAVGYGLGNGLRVELEGVFIKNHYKIKTNNGTNAQGLVGGGNLQTYGALVNVLYDFDVGLGFMYPYVGVGVGYELTSQENGRVYPVGGGAPNLNFYKGRHGSLAAQAILGASFPIAAVPGLSLTADARFNVQTRKETFRGDGLLTNAGPRVLGRETLDTQFNIAGLIGVRYAFNAPVPPAPMAAVVAPAPAPAARTYLVFFDWDRADLTARARQIVAEAAQASTRTSYTKIQVSGNADTSGTHQYNQGLSLRRAETVAAELVRDGVPRAAIAIQAFGDTHLLVPTGPGVREPQNRRVEIVLQ